MKNVLMLAVLILGTTMSTNAQTSPVKVVKETSLAKPIKKKTDKKGVAAVKEAPKVEISKTKK